MIKSKTAKFILLTLFTYLICSAIIFERMHRAEGPSIFADETSYFNHIRTFATQGTFSSYQYGPLYPLVASWVFNPSEVVESYHQIIYLNIFIFSLSFFPILLLAQKILNNKYQALAFALIGVLLPFHSLCTFILAEPLYYLLYNCSLLAIFLSFRYNKKIIYLIAGILLGLSFITKQAAIVLFIATLLTSTLFFLNSGKKKTYLFNTLLCVIGFLLASGSQLLKNIHQNSGALGGYKSAVDSIFVNFFKLFTEWQFYQNFLSQFSYVMLGTFFIFFLSFVLSNQQFVKKIRYWNELDIYSTTLLITLIGVSAMSSLFYSSLKSTYGADNLAYFANGRYLAPLFPSILILGWKRLFEPFKFDFKSVFVVLFFSTLLIRFSPLNSAIALGVTTAPDVTYLNKLFGQGFPPWVVNGDINEIFPPNAAIYLFLGMALFAILIYWLNLKKRKNLILFILVISVLAIGDEVASKARVFSTHAIVINNIFKFLITERIDLNNVYYTEEAPLSNHIAAFWYLEGVGYPWYQTNRVTDSGMDSFITDQKQKQASFWLITKKHMQNHEAVSKEQKFSDYLVLKMNFRR